ncbi:MAG: 4a-hydroxytetrahydrobiopterin dehydratase [Caldilineaceae bacterium]|nr:4a-hydroxytetrahydrobiopterin dehydratase [Caldilineaceae bacterium]
MTQPTRFTDAEIEAALATLDGWRVVDGKLHKEFTFKDFTAAFGFLSQVAIEANTMWHHPELYNVWNKVVIDLVTHEAGDAISARDVELAHKIDQLTA